MERTTGVAFTYCRDLSALQEAVTAARQTKQIVVDCEGRDTGSRNTGATSIIQVLPVAPEAVPFLVDVLAFQRSSLQPLFDMLADPSITKIMYDCRLKSSALWHEFGCELRGVLDMQLLQAWLWYLETTPGQRLGWLKHYIGKNIPRKQQHMYKYVYMLHGVRACLQHRKIQLSPEVANALANKRTFRRTEAWMDRPLNSDLTSYAAADVLSVLALYRKFDDDGKVAEFLSDLQEASDAYAVYYKTRQHDKDDPYCNHSLMPLGVWGLLSPPTINTATGQPYPTQACDGCHKSLPNSCFNGFSTYCYVCSCVRDKVSKDHRGLA